MIGQIEAYWELIREGDERALSKLFNEVYARLCYYSEQITHDKALSEDIVIEVFENLWNKRDVIVITSCFKSYLFQAVRNNSINEIRKFKTLKNAVNETRSDAIWDKITENKHSQDFIIETIISEETTVLLNKIITTLPDQCRRVFEMSRNEGKSNKEIRSILNISEATIRAHIFTALKRIRKAFKHSL